MSAAAVFDLDNTLVEGSSLFHFGKEMMRRRFIGPATILRYARAEFSYVRNRAEVEGMPAVVAERVLGMVAGRQQSELSALADDFVSGRLHRYYVPEILAAVFWTLPAASSGQLLPWFYVAFLIILLTDRAFRDNARCEKKYGKVWAEYTKLVPYMMVPYVI